MRIQSITEAIFPSGKVDRDAGIIRGVKILGRVSKNGREYSDKALSEAARKYDGVDVNVNHPERGASAERKIEDAIGWLESVEVRKDGVYGDLHYLKEHPTSGLLAEAAERRSNRFGLSHNAEGSVKRINGKNVVESIDSVRSVDIVQNPATNRGLFESETRNQVIRETIRKHSPELFKLLEDQALLPPDEELAVEPEMPGAPEEKPDAAIKEAVVALITAAMEGGDDEATMLQKLALIVATRQAIIDGMPSAETETPPEFDENGEPEEEPMETPVAEPGAEPETAAGETADEETADEETANNTFPFTRKKDEEMAEQTKGKKTVEERLALLEAENKKLREENELASLEKRMTALLQEHHRDVTSTRLTALANMPDDKARLALIEDWPSNEDPPAPEPPRRRPNFSAPLRESQSQVVKYPETVKSFAEQCR